MPEGRSEENIELEAPSPSYPAARDPGRGGPLTSEHAIPKTDPKSVEEEQSASKAKTIPKKELLIFLVFGLLFTGLSFAVYPYRNIAVPAAYPNIFISGLPRGAEIQFVRYTVTPGKDKSRYAAQLEIQVGGAYTNSATMFLQLEYPSNKKLTRCSVSFPLDSKASPAPFCPENFGNQLKLDRVIDLDFTVNSSSDYYADDGAEATIALPEVRVEGSLPLFLARFYLQEQAQKYDWPNADRSISGSVEWTQQVPPGGFISPLLETGTDKHVQSIDNLRILVVGAFIAIACSAFFEAVRRLLKV